MLLDVQNKLIVGVGNPVRVQEIFNRSSNIHRVRSKVIINNLMKSHQPEMLGQTLMSNVSRAEYNYWCLAT